MTEKPDKSAQSKEVPAKKNVTEKPDKSAQSKEVAAKKNVTEETHKTAQSKKVSAKKNVTEKTDIVKQSRMHTRSSDGKKTIGETLDEVFDDETSMKTNDLKKRNQKDEITKDKGDKETNPVRNNNAKEEEVQNRSAGQKLHKKKKEKQKNIPMMRRIYLTQTQLNQIHIVGVLTKMMLIVQKQMKILLTLQVIQQITKQMIMNRSIQRAEEVHEKLNKFLQK